MDNNERLTDTSSGGNEKTENLLMSNDIVNKNTVLPGTDPPSLYVDPITPASHHRPFPQNGHARLPTDDGISLSTPLCQPNTFIPSKRVTVQIIGTKKKKSEKVVKIRRVLSDTTIAVEDWLHDFLSNEVGDENLRYLFDDADELSLGPNQSFHIDSANDNCKTTGTNEDHMRGEKGTNKRKRKDVKVIRLELVATEGHALLSPRDPIFFLVDWSEEFILRVVDEESRRSVDANDEGGGIVSGGKSNNNTTTKNSLSGLPPPKKKARKHTMQQKNIKDQKEEKQQNLSMSSHNTKATKTATSMITSTTTTNESDTATSTAKMTKTTSQKHQRNSKGSNDDDRQSKGTAKELINHSVTGVINDAANNDDDDSTNSGKDQDNRAGQKLQDNHTPDKVVKKKSKKKKSQSISDSADIVGRGNDAKEDNVVHGFGDRDVLLGKGKEQNQNSGNVKYSEYIKSKSQEFATKKNRSAITISLASIFRFHKKDNKTGLWNKVESTEASISNKIKRDCTIEICKKVKFEIKKVMDVEKRGQDTDRNCKDNSPSDESNNNGVEDPPKKNDQNVQEEGVSEGNNALSDETFMDENNEVKERDEKLQDTKKSKKKIKSNLHEGEKNNEKEMAEIQNDYAETKEDKTQATTNMEDDSTGNVSGGHDDDDDDDSSSASSSSSTTSDSSDSDSSNSSSSSSSSSSDSSSDSSFCNNDDSNSTTSKKQSKLPNAGHVNAAPAPARRKSARKSSMKKPL